MKWFVAALALAIVAPAEFASGAISVSLKTSSTVTTGAIAPPVHFEFGPAGNTTRYFSPWTLSSNRTVVTGTVQARAGADWTAKDAIRVINDQASSQSITISSTQISNAQLDLFQFYVYNGATLIGTIDMKGATPSLTFSLPASTTYRIDMRLDLADGAGNNNAPTSFTLSTSIGSTLTWTPTSSSPSLHVSSVEVPFGKLISGSSVGSNATNASASVTAHLILAATDNMIYLNNTNASAIWYAKVVYVTSAGLAQMTTLNVGIDNGTQVDAVKIASGTVSQSSGSYQRLEVSSTNKIYATSLKTALFSGTGTVDFDVYVSDTSAGDSYLLTKGRFSFT